MWARGILDNTGEPRLAAVELPKSKLKRFRVACPFFVPTNKLEDGGWLHPSRLPLGAGWSGRCAAPGHEGIEPNLDELREFCNLGYASRCARLPKGRSCDAVRFSVVRDCDPHLTVTYVTESAHRPMSHGTLEFDLALNQWTSAHEDSNIQKMVDCYVQSYLLRRIRPAMAGATEGENS